MKSNKLFRAAAVLLIAANIFAFTACSQQSASAATTNTANVPNAENAQNGQTAIYGKVTAVDGSKITLAVGTLNQRGGLPGNNSGTNSGNSGSGGWQGRPKGDSSNSGAGRAPRGNSSRSSSGFRQGGAPNGWQGGDLLTMTGETKTITITDPSIITRFGMRGGNGDTPRSGQGRPLMKADGSSSAAQNTANTALQNETPAVVNTTADTASQASQNPQAQNGGNGANGQLSASLSDITVGTILRVTFNAGSDTPASVQILGSMGGQSSSSSQSN